MHRATLGAQDAPTDLDMLVYVARDTPGSAVREDLWTRGARWAAAGSGNR